MTYLQQLREIRNNALRYISDAIELTGSPDPETEDKAKRLYMQSGEQDVYSINGTLQLVRSVDVEGVMADSDYYEWQDMPVYLICQIADDIQSGKIA